MPAALFGIDNEGLDLAVNLIVLFLVVVWIALIAWTYLDARRRLEDPVLIASSAAASLFPFVGTIVYSILRPPEFIEDRRERELEIRAAELRVRQLEESACPNCGFPIERTYLRCPSCRARVKDPCESCGKPVDRRWSICPYCEAAVRRPQPAPATIATPTPRAAARRPPAARAGARPATGRGSRAARPKAERKARKAAPSRRAARSAADGSRKPRQASAEGSVAPPEPEAERQPARDA